MRRLGSRAVLVPGILLVLSACVSDAMRGGGGVNRATEADLRVTSPAVNQPAVQGDAEVPAATPSQRSSLSLTESDPALVAGEDLSNVNPASENVWHEVMLDIEASERQTQHHDAINLDAHNLDAHNLDAHNLDAQISDQHSVPSLGGAQEVLESLSGWNELPTTFEGEPLNPGVELASSSDSIDNSDEDVSLIAEVSQDNLQPNPSETLVRVDSTIANAEVWNDGILLGPANAYLTLSPGKHDLEIRALGFVSERRAVRLSPRDKEIIKVDLIPLAAH